MDKTFTYQGILRSELQKRLDKNPNYSQRAFASLLEMNNGSLSRIMNGKRSLSYEVAIKVCRTLRLNKNTEEKFLLSLATHQMESGSKRKDKKLQDIYRFHQYKNPQNKIQSNQQLTQEQFKIIAEWYHYAILQMINLDYFQFNYCWIGSQLGITPTRTKMAIQRLIDLKLLEVKNGNLFRTKEALDVEDKNLTSVALKQRQDEMLKLSQKSLFHDPIHSRNHSGITMAIDPELIPEAKQKIDKFLDELSEFLESGSKSQVYELMINLFPLQKSQKKRKVS